MSKQRYCSECLFKVSNEGHTYCWTKNNVIVKGQKACKDIARRGKRKMIEWDKMHWDRAVVLEMDPKKYPAARLEVWDRK